MATMVTSAAGWGLAVAASLMLGALAASRVSLPERIAAPITAFGGGLLFAAVAFELVPEADIEAGLGVTATGLIIGTLVFVFADAWLSRDRSNEHVRRSRHAAAAGREILPIDRVQAARGEAIAAGIFVDGVPESIALGLTVASKELGIALLVGVLVGNVVEAYGAVRPIIASGHTRRFAVGLIGAIGLTLAGATLLGGTLLANSSPALVGAAQAIAAGAVLAVVSISIIPYAFAEVSREVAFAVAAGFVCGYLFT